MLLHPRPKVGNSPGRLGFRVAPSALRLPCCDSAAAPGDRAAWPGDAPLLLRPASRAASLTRFARSAPVNPVVDDAMPAMSTSSASGSARPRDVHAQDLLAPGAVRPLDCRGAHQQGAHNVGQHACTRLCMCTCAGSSRQALRAAFEHPQAVARASQQSVIPRHAGKGQRTEQNMQYTPLDVVATPPVTRRSNRPGRSSAASSTCTACAALPFLFLFLFSAPGSVYFLSAHLATACSTHLPGGHPKGTLRMQARC